MKKVKIKSWIPIVHGNPDQNGKKTQIAGTGCYTKDFITEGLFHQWGLSLEETNNGIGSYTIGLVQLKDGTVAEVIPSHIKFEEETTTPKKIQVKKGSVKPQIGESMYSNILSNQWTFLMPKGFTPLPGKFAIMDIQLFNDVCDHLEDKVFP